MSCIIIDLDNTIADDEWRIPRIKWEENDIFWRYHDYHSLAGFDAIGNGRIIDMAMYEGHDIVVFTARPEMYRAMTECWLQKKAVPFSLMLMRPDNLHCHSSELKEVQLKALMRQHGYKHEQIVRAYDDREDVIAMYDRNGIKAEHVFIHTTSAYKPKEKK